MSDAPSTVGTTSQKRLALFLDGTWNTVGDNTNVWRLKCLCAKRDIENVNQLVYYDAGLGTQFGEKVRGGVLGYGLGNNLKDAYEWLIDNYNAGDDIFIFGFSRGAYTARSLAGFVAKCGLLRRGAPLSINQLYSRYTREDERTIWALPDKPTSDLTFEERWMLKYCQAIPIKLIAVWDTVGALGVPLFNLKGLSRSTFRFLHTGLRTSIENAFHALAIDEHRKSFSPTLWTKNIHKGPDAPVSAPPRPLAKTEQRWFVGAHANVGGGYENDVLAQVPLRWIMRKAALQGLTFREEITIDDEAVIAPISDSFGQFMSGIYRVIKFGRRYYRPIGEPPIATEEKTTHNVNETIDISVFDRWRKVANYRPKNLIDWARRHGVDITTLHESVKADDPPTPAPD
jgi:uncharacterized protein (DUF2235 family)